MYVCKPVFVHILIKQFTNTNTPITEVARAESRKKNLDKAESLCQQGKSEEAYKYFAQAVDISPRMAAGT